MTGSFSSWSAGLSVVQKGAVVKRNGRAALREGPEQPEAAGDHHVPVRHREVRRQPAAAQLSTLRPGDGDDRAGILLPIPGSLLLGVIDAVTLGVEHVLVRQPAGEKTLR